MKREELFSVSRSTTFFNVCCLPSLLGRSLACLFPPLLFKVLFWWNYYEPFHLIHTYIESDSQNVKKNMSNSRINWAKVNKTTRKRCRQWTVPARHVIIISNHIFNHYPTNCDGNYYYYSSKPITLTDFFFYFMNIASSHSNLYVEVEVKQFNYKNSEVETVVGVTLSSLSRPNEELVLLYRYTELKLLDG